MLKIKVLILLLITHTQFLIPDSPPVNDSGKQDPTENGVSDRPHAHVIFSPKDAKQRHAELYDCSTRAPKISIADCVTPYCHNIPSGFIGEEKVECEFIFPRTMQGIALLASCLVDPNIENNHVVQAVTARNTKVSPPDNYQRFTSSPDMLSARVRFNPKDAKQRHAELQATGTMLANYGYDLKVAQLAAERKKAFWRAMPLVSADTVAGKTEEADQEYRFTMMRHPVNRGAFEEQAYQRPVDDELVPELEDSKRSLFAIMTARVFFMAEYYGIDPIELSKTVEKYASEGPISYD